MNLNPRLIAIDGIGFSAIQLAVNGLLAEYEEDFVKSGSAPGKRKAQQAAKSKEDTRYKAYVDSLNRDYERQLRIKRDDQLATEFIMALVHTEILNG